MTFSPLYFLVPTLLTWRLPVQPELYFYIFRTPWVFFFFMCAALSLARSRSPSTCEKCTCDIHRLFISVFYREICNLTVAGKRRKIVQRSAEFKNRIVEGKNLTWCDEITNSYPPLLKSLPSFLSQRLALEAVHTESPTVRATSVVNCISLCCFPEYGKKLY